jgi:hypothetical protein
LASNALIYDHFSGGVGHRLLEWFGPRFTQRRGLHLLFEYGREGRTEVGTDIRIIPFEAGYSTSLMLEKLACDSK